MKLSTSKGRTGVGTAVTLFVVFLLALAAWLYFRLGPQLFHPGVRPAAFQLPAPLDLASLPTATRFDFPLGSEHGALTYNATLFTEDNHLGEDLNGIGGENSDFGDAIYAIADGRVLYTGDGGPGWGNIVMVLHACEEDGVRKYLQSYYAHVDTIHVASGQNVRRGEQIATVGSAGGRYWAHLHFEMREFLTPFIGPGYREDPSGWINPTEFIQQHRGAPEEDVGRPPL
ncbi:MAG: M23 family metallopeptidase [Chthoniobacterales bacterium]